MREAEGEPLSPTEIYGDPDGDGGGEKHEKGEAPGEELRDEEREERDGDGDAGDGHGDRSAVAASGAVDEGSRAVPRESREDESPEADLKQKRDDEKSDDGDRQPGEEGLHDLVRAHHTRPRAPGELRVLGTLYSDLGLAHAFGAYGPTARRA
jgi:hypothetical protein